MRIRILTVGSYGDVRPYLALARELRARGHDARLVGPDFYARYAELAAVPFAGFGPYFDEDETKRVLAATAAEPDPKRHPRIGLSLSLDSTFAALERAITLTRDADLIIAHNLSVLGPIVAAVHKAPLVTGHLFPTVASSDYWLAGRSFGRPFNRLLWSLGGRFVAWSTDDLYAQVLKRAGLAPRRDFFLKTSHSALLNLIGVSPHVLGRDPDWPAHYQLTGYWSLPEPAFEPSPALRAFLDAGDPPIAITFGSMFGVDAARLTRLLIDALRGSGLRAVLQSGWADLGRGDLPGHILRVDYVPHDFLFSRAAAVLHHGGAGTCAAALRAGKPQVTAFHVSDQPFWSRRMVKLGVSAGTVAHARLDASWLRKALRRALDSSELRRRSAMLATMLRAEDGASTAAQLIEELPI